LYASNFRGALATISGIKTQKTVRARTFVIIPIAPLTLGVAIFVIVIAGWALLTSSSSRSTTPYSFLAEIVARLALLARLFAAFV